MSLVRQGRGVKLVKRRPELERMHRRYKWGVPLYETCPECNGQLWDGCLRIRQHYYRWQKYCPACGWQGETREIRPPGEEK